MKLCPVCKEAIIPDKWPYCFVCEHKIDPQNSAWDGGFPCGAAGRAVAYKGVNLIVKNEIVECDGEVGFAIYDDNDQNVGVLYQKTDDGNYMIWHDSNRGVWCDGERFGFTDKVDYSRDDNKTEIDRIHVTPGDYDVEAVFFSQFRDVFGDNRKIAVGMYHMPYYETYDEIRKSVEKQGSVEYTFFCLPVGFININLIRERIRFKKRY